ncbi:MAG: DNA repair exonuclease [Candidatus Micrarchaeota archaeon]|nr:DNA repair exonuclease [Candidatus Micrarchaeota archaeon]
MKIAIVSDTHLGYERFVEDAFVQAKEALDLANRLADAVILPGDIFDKRSPKPDVIAQAINLFRDLSEKRWNAKVVSFTSRNNKAYTDAPVIAISGTHERTAEGKDNPLNLLGLAGLLIDTSESTTIIEKDGERVAIYGLGGIAEERLKEKLNELSPQPVGGLFSIFMFHQSTYELLPFSDEFIHYDDLPRGFDLYVDGHIHSRVEDVVHGRPFLIPGSTVLTQLKDGEQEPKGFMIYDTKARTHEFVKINSRKFVVKDLKFADAEPEELSRRCENEIEAILSSSADRPIIKLNLVGTIKAGFNSSDMPIHALMLRYSGKAMLNIDNSKLKSPELDASIEGIRENRIGDMPIKELGMGIFASKLKELKFDEKIRYSELFNRLSAEGNKEKVIKEAMDFLAESAPVS